MTTMTTKMLTKPMTTMMLRKHTLTAMFRCASHAGTLATAHIEIADVQTTNALIAASKDISGGFKTKSTANMNIALPWINVDVDWLNILLSVSASHTITELFQASECTVDPNTARSGGKFRKFTMRSELQPT